MRNDPWLIDSKDSFKLVRKNKTERFCTALNCKSFNFYSIFIVSIRIWWEFLTGLLTLNKYSHSISIFGSAREVLNPKYYEDAERLAAGAVRLGFEVLTGGANGIMRHGNKGAYDKGGKSVGLTIQLPFEQSTNMYLDEEKKFQYFFSRKAMLSLSDIYVFFPGGYGTLDELFNMLVLIQTHKAPPTPIILVGKDFWSGLDSYIRKMLHTQYGTIDEKDINLYTIVESSNEALAIIDTYARDERGTDTN